MNGHSYTLFGNTAFKKEIEVFRGKSRLYKYTGTKPNSLILQMDSGEGRTAIMEYAISTFKELSTLDFSSGRDDYIECDFDGSLQNYKNCMAQIDDAAEYGNHYKGGIAVNCSLIANHYSEKHYEDFINRFSEICDSAWVVFFFSSLPSRNEEKLMNKLREKIKHITFIGYEPYTEIDLAHIFLSKLNSFGINFSPKREITKLVVELFKSCSISTVKQTTELALMALDYINYDNNPIFNVEIFEKFSEDLRKDVLAK